MAQSARTLAIFILLALFMATGCVIIEDGQVGVKKSFGEIADEPVRRGVFIQIPVARTVETWNIKLQERKETGQVPSSEGLIIGLDITLLFKILPDAAPEIRKTIGRDYINRLIVPYLRSTMRDVVSAYPVKRVYAEAGRQEIAAKIKERLEESLGDRGIVIEAVLLRDVKLPARFKESIEAKLTAEQRVQQKQFELEQAVKDADIEVARARGAAEAQKIVRSTLSDSYLQYLWIKTLNQNPNVIYVATEANLPIFKNVK
jgi:regulator of protease activity HflC (stomatin/prohibitin superfamily)